MEKTSHPAFAICNAAAFFSDAFCGKFRLFLRLLFCGLFALHYLHVLAASAYGYEIHAAKDEHNGNDFCEIEGIHVPAHGNHTSHYGLDVIVHSRHGGAKSFLPNHYEHVAKECAAPEAETFAP